MFTQEHISKVCLPPELYLAVAKLQVEKEISKSAALLLLITKGAYQFNVKQEPLIDEATYEKLTLRYSRKLIPEIEPPKLSIEQLQEKQHIDERSRYFSMVLDQWRIHGVEWRKKKLAEAEKWKDRIPAAKLVLDLGVEQK